jgi:hypothetical protein
MIDEFRVTTAVAGVFTATFPNDSLATLVERAFVAVNNWSEKVFELVPSLAVSVTACAVQAHHDTVAVKPALVAPAGTVTLAGSVTAELLLARLTLIPLLGAAETSVTLQESCTHPVSEALLHVSALNGTAGFTAGVLVALANMASGKQKASTINRAARLRLSWQEPA